ncbi:MAG: RloB family protein [Pseudomonadota bacterium]|nr:RloB family protein [Pseudomonadota bacterium]
MEKYIKKEQLRSKDEAWLVVDKDGWTDDQLQTVYDWSQKDDRYGLAVSNPKFEFWLLLHFEDGNGIANSHQCTKRLLKWLPNFSKGHVDTKKLIKNLDAAIQRARQKDLPPCNDWPRQTGTTVYKLIEQIQSKVS